MRGVITVLQTLNCDGNIYSLSIQHKVICLQNVYKIIFYLKKIVHQNTWAQL